MTNSNKTTSVSPIRSFPGVFWVVNVFELFERAAYYGLHALLAIDLTDKIGDGGLGFSEDEAGLLQSVVYGVTYLVPILGGVLGDRYGYRKMLILAFAVLGVGYFISGHVTRYSTIFIGLLIMATGAGLFKPLVSGTIARVTDEKNSGLGFGIFYWTINVGAFIAPIVAGQLRLIAWKWVFVASAAYCVLMLIPAIFVYREPTLKQKKEKKKIGQVLSEGLMVLSDSRFVLFIFVYSLFWILYFQNYLSILWFLRDFIDMSPVNSFINPIFHRLGFEEEFTFNAEHITSLNALTIVLFQYFISKAISKIATTKAMLVGMAVSTIGFAVLGLSAFGVASFLILGVVIFTIGEVTCHPKFLSYVGLIAPPDKKAVYIGYSFLYGVIGSMLGANIGGELYSYMMVPLRGTLSSPMQLYTFWLIFVGIGVFAMSMFWLYGKIFGQDTAETRSLARRVMTIVYVLFVLLSLGLSSYALAVHGTIAPKTIVQASIMMLVGVGGFYTLRRSAAQA